MLSSTVFLFVSYLHIHVPFCLRSKNDTLTLVIGSQSFISLPSFLFVIAAVSGICELKEEEERILKLTVSNLRPFLGI